MYRQYDHQLFLNTVVGPGGDATVLRLKHPVTGADTGRALALTCDGNHRWCAVDPRRGTERLVAFIFLHSFQYLGCSGPVSSRPSPSKATGGDGFPHRWIIDPAVINETSFVQPEKACLVRGIEALTRLHELESWVSPNLVNWAGRSGRSCSLQTNRTSGCF